MARQPKKPAAKPQAKPQPKPEAPADAEPVIVIIDGVEYRADALTDEQRTFFNHCCDLDQKIGAAQFQLQQLAVSKDGFLRMLRESLKKTETAIKQEKG